MFRGFGFHGDSTKPHVAGWLEFPIQHIVNLLLTLAFQDISTGKL